MKPDARPRAFVFALVALLLAAMPAGAMEPASTGVVLMHGKWSNPSQMRSLADALRDAGFLVDNPEMPWSGQRLFDRPYGAAMEEIAEAARRLRGKGAARIVVAGQSLGGNAALAYAARAGGETPAAVVLMAPAHFPEGKVFAEKTIDGVAKARAMVAAGEGDQSAGFVSLNDGDRSRPISATANAYLSYYDPSGPAAMTGIAGRVGPAPILWLAGTQDPSTPFFAAKVRPLLPETTPVERIDLNAGHRDVPERGVAKTVEWLIALP